MIEPRLGFRVVRLEVGSDPSEDSELVWKAWVTADDDPDTVVMGYLRSVAGTGFGQARTAAILMGRSFKDEVESGEFEKWIRENVLEHLYDTARRALNSQAAAMDVSLDIPTKAPEIELARLSPETLAQE